ncbi:MAG: CoA-binding protein [Nanoarchaeota archaeon]|nr:CoA-binding protein [Nanoarchaeota archaeon]
MLDTFFNPKSVAIIGASRNPGKIGHVLLNNLIESKYNGKIYPINPKAKSIKNLKCYGSITEAVKANKKPIDLAIISIPTEPSIIATEECGKNKIKNVLSITAGFSEVGNFKAEEKLKSIIKKYNINFIGPNCLGIIDSYSRLDMIFLPKIRLKRPEKGKVSFICQSGAIGSAVLDLLSAQGLGFSKFITYGNATTINETSLLEYLGKDKNTDVICMYIEGVREGRRFIDIAKKVSKNKPIIALKGGLTESGARATLSHTASLAGSSAVYDGAFKQAGIIKAEKLHELYEFAKILEKSPKPKGNRVQVITNGGGFGIITVDNIDKDGLKTSRISKKTELFLKKKLPKECIIHNPIDLTGGATTEQYDIAIKQCLNDKNIDILLVIVLMQTPLLDINVIDKIAGYNKKSKKPIVAVMTGGSFTESQKQRLESLGVPCYAYPSDAVKSIKAFCDYYKT